MQTLNAGQYTALNTISRAPCARVLINRNYESIPFEGQPIQASIVAEQTPKVIYHTNGRLYIVYTKSVTLSGSIYSHVFVRYTDTLRTTWSTAVDLNLSSAFQWTTPTLVELSDGNIGIVAVYNNATLYRAVIGTTGTVITAFTTTSTSGVSPSLENVEGTYWLAYDGGGIIYVKTSAGFVTWGTAVNYNSKTGLSNGHYQPYLYYDTSNKLWLCFQRISDAVATPNVFNVYYITSTNQGSTWSSPVAQTSLVAGGGNASVPSIVDTGTYRYYSYLVRNQIQTIRPTNPAPGYTILYNVGPVFDAIRNRVIMGTRSDGAKFYISIYDRETATFTTYNISDQGMTGAIEGIAYDAVNRVLAIIGQNGAGTGGLLTYNELTTTWKLYTLTSTPALPSIVIQHVSISGSRVYMTFFMNYNTGEDGYVDMTAGTYTKLSTVTGFAPSSWSESSWIEASDNFIVSFYHAASGTEPVKYPWFTIYSVSTGAKLYQASFFTGTDYRFYGVNTTNLDRTNPAYDKTNEVIYIPCSLNNSSPIDLGILKIKVLGSSLGVLDFWSQAPYNRVGLLPHIDPALSKHQFVRRLLFSADRLYVCSMSTPNNSGGYTCAYLYNINTLTEKANDYFTNTNSVEYATTNPGIDALLIKILPIASSSSLHYASFGQWGGVNAYRI